MDLVELRKQIDGIDGQLVTLFNQRMACARQIAEEKAREGQPVLNSAREREVLLNAVEKSDEGVEKYCKILFSTLMDVSKAYQREFIAEGSLDDFVANALKNTPPELPFRSTVAVQGRRGAYSDIAATKLFGVPSVVYFRDFDGVLNAVERGLCKYGVLPIENSSAGSVAAVYEALPKYKFYIVKALKLRVSHSLVGLAGADIAGIKEIISHEQALSQCSRFIATLGNIKVTAAENTAEAASIVAHSGRSDLFALSSADCAELYSLKLFKSNVQNTDNNYTRFICISKNFEVYEGSNKISILVSLPHQKGSLYSLISKFAALDLNLVKIESRPVAGSDFEFLFYFDFEASLKDGRVVKLLAELSDTLRQFTLLGNYGEII